MAVAGVHPAVRDQAHQVNRAVLRRLSNGINQWLQMLQGTRLDVLINPRDILIHHAPGAKVQMADFRVSELALGQANRPPTRLDGGVGTGCQKLVPVGRMSSGDGIVLTLGADAEAIKDDQQDGLDE